MNDDGHFEPFEQVFGTETDERFCPSAEETRNKAKKTLPFNATQQHAKNTNIVIQCEECELWRIVYSKKKLDPQSLSLLGRILDDIVYTCGTTFDELDLPPSLSSVCVRTLQCYDPMEKLYYSCGSFPPICYYCGKDIPIETESSDVYPVCHDCSHQGKVSVTRPVKRGDRRQQRIENQQASSQ